MLRTLLLVAGLLCAGNAMANGPQYIWQLAQLARAPDEMVDLRDDKGRILKRVRTQQLLWLYSVAQAIQEAAEIEAVVLIIDGSMPNAFATVWRATPARQGDGNAANGQRVEAHEASENTVAVNVVAVNFAMLDMLENDVHMMAALIGHELAHLKLNHGEDLAKNRRAATMATAAATRFSRDNEREADYLGAIWAVEAGYDPAGAVWLQELVHQHARFRGSGFSGSHPTSTERIAILKSLARRLSK
jgi:Zn-dependent protease with chaperone function